MCERDTRCGLKSQGGILPENFKILDLAMTLLKLPKLCIEIRKSPCNDVIRKSKIKPSLNIAGFECIEDLETMKQIHNNVDLLHCTRKVALTDSKVSAL
jgi:hypothetical protein